MLQLLLPEVASWRPVVDEPSSQASALARSVVVRVELVGWHWQTSARYPRLVVETSTWRACIALEQNAVRASGGEGYTFTEPMLAVFEELHARSPFVVSTAAAASDNR